MLIASASVKCSTTMPLSPLLFKNPSIAACVILADAPFWWRSTFIATAAWRCVRTGGIGASSRAALRAKRWSMAGHRILRGTAESPVGVCLAPVGK